MTLLADSGVQQMAAPTPFLVTGTTIALLLDVLVGSIKAMGPERRGTRAGRNPHEVGRVGRTRSTTSGREALQNPWTVAAGWPFFCSNQDQGNGPQMTLICERR